MSQLQLLADLGNDVVFFACAGSVAFLAVYLLLAQGWRTEIGRALIMLDAGLTLALGPSVIHRLFGLSLANIGYAWYFVASIALVGVATWWRTWFVIKVQWRGRRPSGPPAWRRRGMNSGAVTSIAFIAALASLTVFIALYLTLAPFYRNPAGRALMVMSSGFWLVTLAQVLRHPFGLSTATSAPFTWFQVGAVAVAVAGIAWIATVLVRVQWRGRRSGRQYFEEKGGDDNGAC